MFVIFRNGEAFYGVLLVVKSVESRFEPVGIVAPSVGEPKVFSSFHDAQLLFHVE